MRKQDSMGHSCGHSCIDSGSGVCLGPGDSRIFWQVRDRGICGRVSCGGLGGAGNARSDHAALDCREGALPGLMRCVAGRSAGGNSLMALLLITVSAAMVAAGGELGALLVNVHGAREMGMALTAVLAGVCVACGMAALKWLGGATVVMMLGYFVVLALRAPEPGPVYVRPGALASAAAYAGFNLTGACGVACAAGLELGSRGDARRAAISVGRATGLLLLALLLAALVCMRVHWAQVRICAYAQRAACGGVRHCGLLYDDSCHVDSGSVHAGRRAAGAGAASAPLGILRLGCARGRIGCGNAAGRHRL